MPVKKPRRSQLVAALRIVLVSIMFSACASIPKGRSAINDVAVEGAEQLDEDDIEEKLATADSPKLLGLFRGAIYDYEILDRVALQRDLARVERYCQARGFYDCRVRAGRIFQIDPKHVRVEIVIEEGKPVRIDKLFFEGLESLSKETQEQFKATAGALLPADEIFDEERFAASEKELQKQLADLGHAEATVKREAAVDIVRHSVDIVFKVNPGPTAVFGEVILEGIANLPRAPVLRAIDIEPGEQYSQSDLESARQAVLDLGVFSSVEFVPDLSRPVGNGPKVVPIRVKLEPSKLRSIRLGGGVEIDTLKTGLHLVAGWEDRNFFGDLRHYSVTVKPGVVLYPLSIGNWTMPERLLPQIKVVNQLRRSGFIEPRTTGFVRPEVGVFPVLLKTNPRESDPIPGYVEFLGVAGVERTIKRLYGRLSYNLQVEDPFTYKGDIDNALRTLVISYPEVVTNLSLTDDRVRPRKGVYVGNIFQAAGGPFGGHADDVSVQPDVRVYVPAARNLTFAARGAVGLLFPRNYGFSSDDEDVDPLSNATARARDQQILFFRGFFAGGPSSNRGYPLRGIGPRGFVASYNAGGVADLAACEGAGASDIAEECKVPIGGLTRWEASAETRVNLSGPLSAATFCDAADVSPDMTDIRLMRLHLSCGLGGRYDTPVGPIRLDVGYRIPTLQVLDGPDSETHQPEPLFGLFPVAVAIGIGEAF